MSEINLTIYGNPVPQGRPRFARIRTKTGKDFMTTYDPKTSRDWKQSVREQAIINKVPFLNGALEMEITFNLNRPPSLPPKVIHHIKKPDLDNLCKSVKDALKTVAYRDDSQIIKLTAVKCYGMRPQCRVLIREIE